MIDDTFKWGVATSAYQIEGAHNKEGKVPSIWDRLSHIDDYVLNGHTGDIACNHYTHWKEDVDLMKDLGVNSYRFSISWSRVMRHSSDTKDWKNERGIAFYKKLVSYLIKNDIEPFVTLYHWDLPVWSDDNGGWDTPSIVKEFKTYASLMYTELPEVKHWITFNEPAVFIGNYWGLKNFGKAVKHVLLSHGAAVEALRDINPSSEIGISLNLIPILPYNSQSISDCKAATDLNIRHNKLWLDPLYKGEFPEQISELYHLYDPLTLTDEEKARITAETDFLGINYYTMQYVTYDKQKRVRAVPTPAPVDDMNVSIEPSGLYYICNGVHTQYHPKKIYITENGCAYSDGLTHDRRIHDERRIKYMRHHLAMLNKTRDEGIPIEGYFYWSLLDNFEWTYGYTKRFGLIYVHYPTLERIPKDSFQWYKKIITDKTFRNNEIDWDTETEEEKDEDDEELWKQCP